jgi:hypothetical protein
MDNPIITHYACINGVGMCSFIRILYGAQVIDRCTVEQGGTLIFGVYDQMGLALMDLGLLLLKEATSFSDVVRFQPSPRCMGQES